MVFAITHLGIALRAVSKIELVISITIALTHRTLVHRPGKFLAQLFALGLGLHPMTSRL